ncbi:MAG: HesA/MoeB/ThiF family protein [Candidatus Muiribacteriota bacterium]
MDSKIFEKNIEHLGKEGAQKFSELNIAIVGAGGLGTPVVQNLLSLGVKKITIFDKDKLELSNLNRQFMFGEADIGKYKASLLFEKIKDRFYNLQISYKIEEINKETINNLDNFDYIFDCCDNFKTKFLLNDYSVENDKILVHAGVNRNHGQVLIVEGNRGLNLRNIIPETPEESKTVNVAPNVMLTAALATNEFMKHVTNQYSPRIHFFKSTEDGIRINKVKI